MANQTNLNIRTDAEVKANAEKIFEQLGLNMSTAVNIFLRQAIRYGGLPFEVKLDIPNDATAAAIAEGKAMLKDKTAAGCKSIDELKAALEI
jgi:DNA-damage-inducible protein J